MAAERVREPEAGTGDGTGRSGPGRATILKRAWAESKRHRLPLMAAGVAFYAFLAIIPTLIAAVLVYGLVSDPEDVTDQVEQYASALPDYAQQLLTEQMATVAEGQPQTLGISLAIALAVALWSASTGVANLITAINITHNIDENAARGFFARRGLALLFTLGAIIFMLVAIALVAALPPVLNALDLPGWTAVLIQIGRWVVLLAAVMIALAVLYRWAPAREASGLRVFSFGAVLATVLWVVISVGFSLYVDNFGNYGETYGSLAGVVVVLLWLWLSAFAALFGAEVNAEAEFAAGQPARPAE